MKKIVSTFIVLYVLWVALSGMNVMELITGAIVSLVLAVIISQYVSYDLDGSSIIKGIKYVALYLPLFIWKLILANFEMAKIVLAPSLPIQPGFVVIKTGLKTDIGKLSLANSITLTPGTLSIDVNEDEILIHWVKVEGTNEMEQRDMISKSFEKSLGGIFE